MFNLHKNDACSMFWLRSIFPRYSNQENDEVDVSQEGG